METFTFRLGPTFATPFTTFYAAMAKLGTKEFQIGIVSDYDTRYLRAKAAPGVDPILVWPWDPLPLDAQPVGVVKLALTQPGLDAAVPGAAMDLGVTEIYGGPSGIVSFWARITDIGQISSQMKLRTTHFLEWNVPSSP